jgi:hypothetical protein
MKDREEKEGGVHQHGFGKEYLHVVAEAELKDIMCTRERRDATIPRFKKNASQ